MSTQKNIAVHIRSYQIFCEQRALQSFPISVKSISLYIANLVMQKRASGTILNHLSSLKHAHQIAGYELPWSSNYHFQLLLRGTKCFLGQAVARKMLLRLLFCTPHLTISISHFCCTQLCGLCF